MFLLQTDSLYSVYISDNTGEYQTVLHIILYTVPDTLTHILLHTHYYLYYTPSSHFSTHTTHIATHTDTLHTFFIMMFVIVMFFSDVCYRDVFF